MQTNNIIFLLLVNAVMVGYNQNLKWHSKDASLTGYFNLSALYSVSYAV